MARTSTPATPPIPSELAGEIDAAQALISWLLMQRGGVSPDRVIAFARWEKKARVEMAILQERAARLGSDHAEATAAAALTGKGDGR